LLDLICVEFSCLPSAAERELETHGERVLDVLWTRMYTRAKSAYDEKGVSPERRVALLADPMVQLVRDTEFALAAEALAAKRSEGG